MRALVLVAILIVSLSGYAQEEPIMLAPSQRTCALSLTGMMKKRNSSGESWPEHYARRQAMEAQLPAYSTTAKSVFFQYSVDGLQLHLEQGRYVATHDTNGEVKAFHLIYNPQKFSRASVVRRALGEEPLVYGMGDVRIFAHSSLMSEEGYMFEIYLKGPPSSPTREQDGALLMITRDTGRIRFYPPGTDVDGNAEGVLRGSLSAIWGFAVGLADESQNSIRRNSLTGQWFTDADVIDLGSRNLPQHSGHR